MPTGRPVLAHCAKTAVGGQRPWATPVQMVLPMMLPKQRNPHFPGTREYGADAVRPVQSDGGIAGAVGQRQLTQADDGGELRPSSAGMGSNPSFQHRIRW